MTTPLGRRFTLSREATAAVQVEKVRLGIDVSTVFTFVWFDEKLVAPLVVSVRSSALRTALVDRGWPVQDFLTDPLSRRPATS
jgi:hypothetical protein